MLQNLLKSPMLRFPTLFENDSSSLVSNSFAIVPGILHHKYFDADEYDDSLSVNATIMVSNKFPVIGEQVVVIAMM